MQRIADILSIILIILILCSCDKSAPETPVLSWKKRYEELKKDCDKNERFDSVSMVMQNQHISFLDHYSASLKKENDSLISVNRNLKDSLFLRRAQIANCKKYVRICVKNPTQDQFLKGWIIRALE